MSNYLQQKQLRCQLTRLFFLGIFCLGILGVADPTVASQPAEPANGSTNVSPSDPQTAVVAVATDEINLAKTKPTAISAYLLYAVLALLAVLLILVVLLNYFGLIASPSRAEEEEACMNDLDAKSAFDDFLELFFEPMIEDGSLANTETAPLSAAYFALGVEEDEKSKNKTNDLFKQGMLTKIDDLFSQKKGFFAATHVVPQERRTLVAERLVKAWKRMNGPSGLGQITQADRLSLLEWIMGRFSYWETDSLTGQLEEIKEKADTIVKQYCKKNENPHKKRVLGYFSAAEGKIKSLRNSVEATLNTPSVGLQPSQPIVPDVPAKYPVIEAVPAALPTASTSKSEVESHEVTAAPEGPAPVISSPQPAFLPPPPKVVRVDLKDKLQHIQADVAAYVKNSRRHLEEQAPTILAKMRELFGDFSKPTESPLAFSKHRTLGTGHVVVIKEDMRPAAGKIWFLGDLHGDLLSLESALTYIDAECPESTIIFLGDLFDDEGFGYEVVLRVFQLITERPNRIGFIVGNHDTSLTCTTAETVTFSSSVSPSDFADFLNSKSDDPTVSKIGQLAVDFFKAAPRAIFMPDGLVAVHGGVPLGTRNSILQKPADLERSECLQDFTWTRAHERARKKIPNPTSKTSEFGFEDFTIFCEHVSKTLDIPTKRMIRGHDHFEAGHSTYERWSLNQCVTVNTLSRRLPRDPFGTFDRTPCVARWCPDLSPEIHQLIIPAEIIRGFYEVADVVPGQGEV